MPNFFGSLSLKHHFAMKGLLGDTRLDILLPGSEIPNSFHHQSTVNVIDFLGRVISFMEPAESDPNIAGIAFCAALGVPEVSQKRANASCEIQFFFVNKRRTYGFVEQFPLLEFDHRWLHYAPRRKMWGLNTMLQNKFSRFVASFAASPDAAKCCGVQVIYTKKETQKVENEQQNLS